MRALPRRLPRHVNQDKREQESVYQVIKECPVHAIRFFLGEDIGGKGCKVHTEKVKGQKNDIVRWIFELNDGSVKTIDIDPKESNKY